MSCKQNNFMTAALLANKETREQVMPLLKEIDDLSKKTTGNPHLATKLDTKEKQLEGTVYSLFMFGDKKDIYKPILADQFRSYFMVSGDTINLEKSNLVNSIYDNPKPDGTSVKDDLINTYKKYVDMIGDKYTDDVVLKAADMVQNKLMLSYVNASGLKQSDKIAFIKGEKVPKSIKRDPIYKAIQSMNTKDGDISDSIDKKTINQYILASSLLNGGDDIDTVIENLIKVYSKDADQMNADLLVNERLETIVDTIIAKIDGIDEKQAKKIKELVKKEQGITEDGMSLLLEKAARGPLDIDDKYDLLFDSLAKKMDFVNREYGTNFNLKEFTDLIQDGKGINFIEKAIKGKLSDNPTEAEKNASYVLKKWFDNYKRPENSVLNSILYSNIKVIGNTTGKITKEYNSVVLLKNPPKKTSKKGADIGNIFTETKKIYKIELGKAQSATVDTIIDMLKNDEKIDTILVESENSLSDKAIKEIQKKINEEFKDRVIQFGAPNKQLQSIFDIEGDKLVIGSDSYDIIDTYRRLGLVDGGYVMPIAKTDKEIGQILDDYINVLYGDLDEAHKKAAMVVGGNSPVSYENALRVAHQVNKDTQYYIGDPSTVEVTKSDIQRLMDNEGMGQLADDFELDENAKNIYKNVEFIPAGPTERQDRILNMQKFAELVKKDYFPKGEPRMEDMTTVLLRDMIKDDYNTQFDNRGLEDMVKILRDGKEEDLETLLLENEYFARFIKKNEGRDVTQTVNKMSSIVKGYDYVPSAKEVSGFGTYLRYDPSKYGVDTDTLLARVIEGKKDGAVDIKKTLSNFKSNINNAIDEYVNDITKAIAEHPDGVPTEKARSLKSKIFVTLRENEFEMENYLTTRTGTNVYSIPSGYTNDDLEFIIEGAKNLKERYGIQIDEYTNNIGKNVDTVDKVPLSYKGAVYTVNQNQVIKSLVDTMPDGVDISRAIPNLDGMSRIEKENLINSLRTAKNMYYNNIGTYASVMDQVTPGFGKMVFDYANKAYVHNETIVYLPKELGDGTTLGIPKNVDMDLKIDVLRKVTDRLLEKNKGLMKNTEIVEFINETFDTMKVEDVIKATTPGLTDEAAKEMLFNMKEAYAKDFLPYTLVPKLDKNLLTEANSKISKIKGADRYLANINYVDVDGTLKPIYSQSAIDTTSYPDILLRRKEKIKVEDIQGVEGVDKGDIRKNIFTAVDDAEWGMKLTMDYDTTASTMFKNEARPILSQRGRGQYTLDTVNRSLNTGQMASAEWTPWFTSLSGFAKNARTIFGGSGGFDVDNVKKTIDQYNKFMFMDSQEFYRIAEDMVTSKDPTEKAGYLTALHYRNLKSRLSTITSEQAFNQKLVKDVDNIFEGVIEEGKFASKGQDKLTGILQSMKNGEIFYGLKSFEDEGIRYLTKEGKAKFFGFNTDFADEGLTRFNELFNSNLSAPEYRTVAGSLFGNTGDISLRKPFKFAMGVMRYANSPMFRTLSAIPGSILTGIPSSGGYIGTMLNYQKQFPGFANFDGINQFRSKLGLLDSVGADVGGFNKLFKDGYDTNWNTMESIAAIAGNKSAYNMSAMRQLFGQSFDNGQNIVDAAFAPAMKNRATINAIRSEGYNSLEELEKRLNDPQISETTKRQILDRITTKTYDAHEGAINYIGRGISKNIDNGTLGSKIAGITSLLLAPINFRAGLGNNAILNMGTNILRLIKYGQKYKIGEELFTALGKDPVMKAYLASWINDFAMGLKLANLNDQGEDINDRELTWDDIFGAMEIASQNFQFLKMSAGARILKSGYDEAFDEKGNVAYKLYTEYMRSAFRETRTSRIALEGLRVAIQRDPENARAYFNKALEEMSTSGLRYVTLSNKDTVFAPDPGIASIFGGSNAQQELFYYNPGRKAQLDKAIEAGDYGAVASTLWESVVGSNLYRLVGQGVGLGLDIVGLKYDGFAGKVKEELGFELEKSYLDAAKLIDSYNESPERQRFQGGKYNFEQENLSNMTPDQIIEKNIEITEIMQKLKTSYVVGGEDFKGMVENFVKDGTTEFENKNGYKHFNDESLVTILTAMKEDGTLDEVRNIMNNSRNEQDTKIELTNFFNSYVERIDDKTSQLDLRQAKSLNSYRYDQEVRGGQYDLRKEIRKRTGDKKAVLSEVDKLGLEQEFVARNLDAIQYIGSDGQKSWIGQDLSMDIYAAKNQDELNKLFFEYKMDGDKVIVTGMKPKYAEAIRKQMDFESELAKGEMSANVIAQGIHGPFSVWAIKDGKGNFDKQANVEAALHYTKFVDNMGWLDQTQKDYLKIQVLTSMPNGAMDIKDIEEKMGMDIADDFRLTTFQSFNDSQKLLRAEADTKTSKGSKAKIPDIKLQAIKLKEYVDRNVKEMYNDKISLPDYKTSSYGNPRLTRGDTASKPPAFNLPSGSAKSVDLFPTKKSKSSPKVIKPTKTKKKKIKLPK